MPNERRDGGSAFADVGSWGRRFTFDVKKVCENLFASDTANESRAGGLFRRTGGGIPAGKRSANFLPLDF